MLFEKGNEGLKQKRELCVGHHGELVVVEQSLAKQRVGSLLAGVRLEHTVHAKALAGRLYSLVASGQINLRRIDGYEKIVDVIAREEDAAA